MSTTHHENVISNTNTGVRLWSSTALSNGYVPFHWHESLEINLTLKGQLTYHLGGQTLVTHANEFIIVPSGVVYDVQNTPNQGIVLQVPIRVIDPYFQHPEEATFLNGHPEIKEYGLVVRLMKELNTNNQTQPIGYRFDNGILLLEILKIVFTKFRSPKPNTPIKEGIKECIVYLNDHLQGNFTVASLAHHFGYNPNYFSRLFKEQTGISLTNYVYMIKINNFYHDLVNTDQPIDELLRQNGLRNERTARAKFKQMFDQLPNEIRRKS